MKLPSLSVIVPNYNHARHLPACLRAIATQSAPPDEIIVIDDASTDNSVEVLEGLARQYPLVKIYRNAVNQGAMRTVNRGIDLAGGEFVCLPGADDEIMPGLFEKSLRLLAEHPQAGLCATVCRMRDLQSQLSYDFGVAISSQPCFLPPLEIVELARQGRLLLFGTSMLWRREALVAAGKYQMLLRWHCDWFAMFALAFRHGLCFVPEVLGEFRKDPSSLSNSGMKKIRVQLEVLRGALDLLDRPENQDVAPLFRRSGILAPFGKEMLWLVLAHRRYWKNINPTFLRQSLWWTLRIEVKKILPRFAARLYFKLSGVSAESPTL
jgi:glycosyltransferase involved in cell wall biosynthesis